MFLNDDRDLLCWFEGQIWTASNQTIALTLVLHSIDNLGFKVLDFVIKVLFE